MNARIVAKFGGSSLADAGQFRKVIDIVLSNPHRRHIVVSAPGKRHKDDHRVTDLLYELHRTHIGSGDGNRISELVGAIADRYEQIATGLGLSFEPRSRVHAFFRSYHSHYLPDALASIGEYLSAQLLAEALGFDFIDASRIIKFDANGNLDMFWTSMNRDVLMGSAPGYVIPGFYGSLPDEKIKTFSRGGSDLSGAIIAAITDATVYENWTDVSGIMMAPPEIVPDARKIDVVSYKELRELTYMGGSVLHEEVVYPLRKAGIPIHVRNTNCPQDIGTKVVLDERVPPRAEGTIVGVAGRVGFTALTLEKTLMNKELGFIRKVCAVFERHGISIEHIPGGIDTICVVVDTKSIKGKIDHICKEIADECQTDSLIVRPNMALVCTVGNAMVQARGVASRLFEAVADAGVNISLIDQGTSERNVIIGVDDDDFEKTVNAIYSAFTS